jgi:hypothetical protein
MNKNAKTKKAVGNVFLFKVVLLYIFVIHDDISLIRFVIPGLTEPALACPVLDTGYLVRGNPVFLKEWFPAFAGTVSGFLLEFIPYLIRGRNDGLCCD